MISQKNKPSNSVILNLIQNQSKNILPISPSPRVERVGVRLAFTLVELIVVIVILSILATIAFLSFNSYSSSSRDSVRLSDVNNFSKSLELYQIKVGSYPTPDNSFTITYSGGGVWYQGTLGDTITRKLGNLSKKAIDPLSNTEYTYSLLSYGNSYQIKANYEGDSISFLDIEDKNSVIANEMKQSINNEGTIFNYFSLFNTLNKVQASNGNPRLAYIKGNYMGVVVKTTTGSTICILAIPSIITNTGSSGNIYEIGNNTLSGTLLYHGQSNTNGLYFNPNKVVYCSTSLPTNNTNSGLTNIASGIINAYSGTIITTLNPTIQTIVNTPTSQLSTLGSNIVSGQLGGSLSNNTSQTITEQPGTSSSNPGLSCNDIKTQNSSSADGLYWIKPTSNPAFQVYCDMTTNGGGWTLAVRIWTDQQHLNTANIGTLISYNQTSSWKLSDSLINSIPKNTGYKLVCGAESYIFSISCVFAANGFGNSSCNPGGFDQPGTGVCNYNAIGQLIYGYNGRPTGCRNSSDWGQSGQLRIK